MSTFIRTRSIAATVLVAGLTVPAIAQSPATPAPTTVRIVAAAQAVVATLDDAGRAKVQYPWGGAQKTRWSNLPSPLFERQGLKLADLTAAQRDAVTKLLTAAFSGPGYKKVTEIMHGDEVLRQRPGRPPRRPTFGENEYYLAFVGTLSTATPWTIQFGGHHLAINLTMGGSQATMAPSHTAAQPATYTVEGRTVRPLGAENDKAFALVNALDAAQQKQAILNYRVADLVLGPTQDGKTIQPEGVKVSTFNASQQTMLLEIVREWTGIMNDAYADVRMAEIKTNLPQTYFAWSGPTTNGSASYFRIQGPTLVIEYAPQKDVDHIHTIYRDPTNDYGAKFTKK